MRPVSTLIFFFASLVLPVAAAASEPAVLGPTSLSASLGVREAERQRAQALNERDVELLRRLIGVNYRHIETNGRLRSKTEFLQGLARDEYRIRHYALEDMEVEVVDEDVAIVTGTWRAARLAPAAGQAQRGRYVRVWTRRPEGWRMALHQGTEIKAALPPSAR